MYRLSNTKYSSQQIKDEKNNCKKNAILKISDIYSVLIELDERGIVNKRLDTRYMNYFFLIGRQLF